MRVSSILLSGMPAESISFVSDPVKASGYEGPSAGLHTVSISVANFAGRVTLQGSLASAPTEQDWFTIPFPPPVDLPVIENSIYGNYVIDTGPVRQVMLDQSHIDTAGSLPYLEFPRSAPYKTETATVGFSFYCQCAWLRASVDRSYFLNTSIDPRFLIEYGTVDLILVNFS